MGTALEERDPRDIALRPQVPEEANWATLVQYHSSPLATRLGYWDGGEMVQYRTGTLLTLESMRVIGPPTAP